MCGIIAFPEICLSHSSGDGVFRVSLNSFFQLMTSINERECSFAFPGLFSKVCQKRKEKERKKKQKPFLGSLIHPLLKVQPSNEMSDTLMNDQQCLALQMHLHYNLTCWLFVKLL